MRSARTLSLFLALAWGLASAAQEASRPFVRRPLEVLLAEARTATPPARPPARLTADLVDVVALDPTLRLDIRYATPDNFLGAPVYTEGRAFLQRPAAQALARVNARLRRAGLALRIHDAYRPWWVTKLFWEATEPARRAYVADPAKGSVHNRGCAVDLDLVRLADGAPLEMPSAYDDFSPRAHADYPGGSEEARRNRELLRGAMEAEGFTVLKDEWWHFDFAGGADYPVLNLPFEVLVGPPKALAEAGQLLLVTTPGWDGPKARLQRFERRPDGSFATVGAPLSAWVGRAGLAWRSDAGAPPPPGPGPVKREGDGRSPAGILAFGGMWGYAATAPEGVRFPYRSSTECDRCVDDPDDPDYGRILRTASADAPRTWKSAEHLRMDSEHYRYLLVIHYNDLQPRKGAGSCIFLHVAPPPGGGTAGCTALAAEELLALLRWMDPARHPVLVQLPEPLLESAAAAWGLPAALRVPAP